MLVEFASVVAAVECAAAIQVGLADRNRGVPSDERVEFRIGVNLDEVIADGADIFGDGFNIAARLEAILAELAGREMGVRYVLQGAVRRSGGHLRVTTELTDVVARPVMWAELYGRCLSRTVSICRTRSWRRF